MRQETIVKTYGTFEELTKERQLVEIENYKDINVDYDWYDDTLLEFTRALKILGFKKVDISFRGFCSQGDGASFTGEFNIPSDADTLKMRLEKVKSDLFLSWDILKDNESLFKHYEGMAFIKDDPLFNETLSVCRIDHHYSHSNTITCDNDSVKDFARSFSDLIYKTLEKEHEFLTSDEQVKETLISNEMEFLISEVGV